MTNIEQAIKTIEEGLNKKVVYSVSEGMVFKKPEVHYTDISIEIYKNFKMHFYLVDKIDALKKILVKGVNKSLVREQVMSLINDFEKEEVEKC